ncbi:glycerol 3-phosphatase 1 [Ilyonectria robusta]
MEGLLPKNYGHIAVEIPGARTMLDDIIALSGRWAIVTSGTVPLVTGWLKARSLPQPNADHLITAESVKNGKPDPACYRLGRSRLGLDDEAAQVLVLEDSPAGIRAGKDAGCKVLGLVTSHTIEQVVAAEPDWVVRDLESVKVVRSEGGKSYNCRHSNDGKRPPSHTQALTRFTRSRHQWLIAWHTLPRPISTGVTNQHAIRAFPSVRRGSSLLAVSSVAFRRLVSLVRRCATIR